MASPSQNKIKVGFVGLSASSGWAGMSLAPALFQPSSRELYDLIAVSTTSEKSAAASADKYSKQTGHPIKAYYGETSQIASDADIDLVAVSVKAPFHKAVVLPVIEAKKDFFLEWPAGCSTQETEEIAAAARKNGVKTMIGLQSRHSVVIQKVKELLASGIIGTIRSTNFFAHNPREMMLYAPFNKESYEWILEKKNGTSLLAIGIAHHLDTLTNVLGDFVSVTATDATFYPRITIVDDNGKPTGRTVPSKQPDHFVITGFLESGVLANIVWRSGYVSNEGRRQYIWEIEGEDGCIRLQSVNDALGLFPGRTEHDLYLNGKKVEIETVGSVIDNCRRAWKEFADGTENYATIEDAVKHHRLLDAIEASAKDGRRITLG